MVSTFAHMPIDEDKRRRWTILQVPHQMPSASGTPRYIVHLYSGRRREGDFHFHMQAILHNHQIATSSILILSIDTAIHERLNIHSPELWHFLEMITTAGQVLALLLGPPCETWSSARFESQYDEAGQPLRGPRPLRGDLDCWGLQGCSLHELAQLSVGNTLLLKGLQLSVPVAAHGGAAALEHPAPPFQLERPSIWRTGILKLLSSPGGLFRRYSFQQWRHGAEGVKPTTLLYANSQIPKIFCENEQRDLVKPTAPLIGRDASGTFRTAVAKEYPSGMNRCFALAFWARIPTQLRLQELGPSCIPPLAAELASLSVSVDHNRSWMPDYQPVN